jgi:hypothetical protein
VSPARTGRNDVYKVLDDMRADIERLKRASSGAQEALLGAYGGSVFHVGAEVTFDNSGYFGCDSPWTIVVGATDETWAFWGTMLVRQTAAADAVARCRLQDTTLGSEIAVGFAQRLYWDGSSALSGYTSVSLSGAAAFAAGTTHVLQLQAHAQSAFTGAAFGGGAPHNRAVGIRMSPWLH